MRERGRERVGEREREKWREGEGGGGEGGEKTRRETTDVRWKHSDFDLEGQ